MIAESVLDHYYLELLDGSLAVVVGNWHLPCCIIGYVKYKPTTSETQWSGRFTRYERLVKVYKPELVHYYTAWSIYVPYFDTRVPFIPLSKVTRIFNPVQRSRELHSRVEDRLEKLALTIISLIEENTDVTPGITGSLLPGIHNTELSDVDLVVYGARNGSKVVELVESEQSTFMPLRGELLSEWANQVATVVGLTKGEVLKYYRNWRRGVFDGRMYSIIYSDGVSRCLSTMPRYETVGITRALVRVSGGVEALNYPSIGLVEGYRVIEKTIPKYDVSSVMSYEALYMTGLYEGGLFDIEGLLQCSEDEGACRILLGSLEYRGAMMWLDGWKQS